jgi:HK97 family phage major capsid protein
MDQNIIVRDAKNVAGCATSTHDTMINWKERKISVEKIRDFTHICLDMMDDFDFVEGEVRKLIETSVQLKKDDQLLNGDGEAPNLNSIKLAASTFDAANATEGGSINFTESISKANIFDLIVVASAQIAVFGKDNAFMANTILINTVERYKNMMIKNDRGDYLIPPFVVRTANKEWTIDDMTVRTNPNILANTMYIFDSTKGTIYRRRGLTVEMSYENSTNFEHEVVTIKAYERLNLLIRNIDKNAFMFIADINAAITAITKPEPDPAP